MTIRTNPFMTPAYGEARERQIDRTVPGMAFFAGTGPPGKTCGDCRLLGYHRKCVRYNEHNEPVEGTRFTSACAKFRQLSGKDGPIVSKRTDACKYFEPAKQ